MGLPASPLCHQLLSSDSGARTLNWLLGALVCTKGGSRTGGLERIDGVWFLLMTPTQIRRI